MQSVKKYSVVVFLTLLSVLSYGQKKINYEVLRDNPDRESLVVSLDYFTVDLNSGFKTKDETEVLDVTVGMGYGFQFNYRPGFGRICYDFAFRKNYNLFGAVGGSYLETGVTYQLSSKVKKTPISLRYGSAGYNKSYVMTGLKANQSHRFKLRAGLVRTKTSQEHSNYRIGSGIISSFGAYGGVEYESNTNYKLLANKFKDLRNFGQFRFYGDVIFAPTTKNTFDENVKTQLDSVGAIPSLGYRLGTRIIMPFPNGFNFNFDANIGVRPPYPGIYFYLGMGATFNFPTNLTARKD